MIRAARFKIAIFLLLLKGPVEVVVDHIKILGEDEVEAMEEAGVEVAADGEVATALVSFEIRLISLAPIHTYTRR